jgi:hypothetical protein
MVKMPANVLGTALEPAGCPPAPGHLMKVSGVQLSQVIFHRSAESANPISPMPVA